jgi:hypothetical protein
MKMKYTFSLLVALSLSAFTTPAAPPDNGLVVHEWGTFTSFAAADGALLAWKPLETSKLPQFIYNVTNPGLSRVSISAYAPFGKGMAITTQRMETPVVYFYSDHEQTVDLAVKFPKGAITEWYPQATQYGPSRLPTNMISTITPPSDSTESLIRWAGLEIIPKGDHADISLPTDSSGSHYFAARETDSDYLRSGSIPERSPKPEFEKFLFYRGVGNFTTPLKVTMTSDDAVTLANTGSDVLPDLFVLTVKNNVRKFYPVTGLKPGEEISVLTAFKPDIEYGASFTMRIKQAMSHALVRAGLYRREADAMVKTWEDSWFAEDGVRVLYILPRPWTDGTLPMTLTPTPRELVRVMVGRAEVLAPGTERSLVEQLGKAGRGDAAAAADTRALLRSLGRFAEPAFARALNTAKIQPTEQTRLLALLDDARKAN